MAAIGSMMGKAAEEPNTAARAAQQPANGSTVDESPPTSQERLGKVFDALGQYDAEDRQDICATFAGLAGLAETASAEQRAECVLQHVRLFFYENCKRRALSRAAAAYDAQAPWKPPAQ